MNNDIILYVTGIYSAIMLIAIVGGYIWHEIKAEISNHRAEKELKIIQKKIEEFYDIKNV